MAMTKKDPRVRGLLDRVAELEQENAALREENGDLTVELGDDEWLKREIAALREFIADVRLGIRDLSEYEDVCGERLIG